MIRSRSTRSQDLRLAVVDVLTICAPVIVASIYANQVGSSEGEKYNDWLASLSGHLKFELNAFMENFSRALARDNAHQAFVSLVKGDVGGARGLVSLITAPEINATNVRPSFSDVYSEAMNFFSNASLPRHNVLNVLFYGKGVLERANIKWLVHLLEASSLAQTSQSPTEGALLALSQESDTPTEIVDSPEDGLLSPLSILGAMRQTSGELREQEASMVELVRSHSGGSVYSPQEWFGGGVDIDDVAISLPSRTPELLRHADALLSLVLRRRLFSSKAALQFRVIRQEDLSELSLQKGVVYFYHDPELFEDNLQIRFCSGGDVTAMQSAIEKIENLLTGKFATIDDHAALMLSGKCMQGLSLSAVDQIALSQSLSSKENYILPTNDRLLSYVWTILKYEFSMHTWFCPTLINAAVPYSLFKVVVMRERPYENSNIVIDYHLQSEPEGAGVSFANSVATFFSVKIPGQAMTVNTQLGKVSLSVESPNSRFSDFRALYKSGGYKASQALAQQIQAAQEELQRNASSSSNSNKRARIGDLKVG